MIRTMLHNINTGETRCGGEELLAEWVDNQEQWIWADFVDVDPEYEKGQFLDTFDLHPLSIADARRERHPPKLEVFDNFFFLLMHGLDVGTTDIDFKTIKIAFFVGERFLVTRRTVESVSVDTIWTDAGNGNEMLSRGPAHVACRIIRRITDRYTNVVEGMEQKLDDIEVEMFEDPRDDLLESLIHFGRNLKRLQRIFNYHQEIFSRLRSRDHPFVDKLERHEFTDVFEHTERLASLTSLYKDLTDDLMNGYISVTSHRLNQVMKVLTIVTVIFLPLTLMVGIYGTNFQDIPELKIKNGYFIFLGVMGLIVTGLLILFRKVRWL